METFLGKKVGILGGGQLGKMLCAASNPWHLNVSVLDKTEENSAYINTSRFVVGDYTKYEDVYHFGQKLDLLTIEIEHVNIRALKDLRELGLEIHPSPDALEIIQDKWLQKTHFINNHIPTTDGIQVDSAADIRLRIDAEEFVFPFVQKLRKGGYDGKGVAIIESIADLNELLDGPSVIEKKVDVWKELSIIASRNKDGETVLFPPVEMVFDGRANLVDRLICPADIDEATLSAINEIAHRTITSLNICGLLAIEFFLTSAGDVLINEVAPRPHNSGHHTIEACQLSQFDLHWRGILNLPLIQPRLLRSAAMINIIGPPHIQGIARYKGVNQLLKVEDVYLHLYGKKTSKPYRKLGHYTVLADDLANLARKIDLCKSLLAITVN